MRVNPDKCVGCANCVLVCTMGVIRIEDGKAVINEDECVECGTCKRFLTPENLNPTLVRAIRGTLKFFHVQYDPPVDVCPTGALWQPEMEYPRNIRAHFSDPTVKHPTTGVGGRGTEEIKTNDVTGRLGEGDAGLIVEMGRPGTGARLRELEKMSMALAKLGPHFEAKNPVTSLMVDTKTGQLKPEVLNEKVMSAIIEMKVPMERLPEFIQVIREVAATLETVISVAVAGKCGPGGEVPYEELLRDGEWKISLNSKTNLGLGRRTAGGTH